MLHRCRQLFSKASAYSKTSLCRHEAARASNFIQSRKMTVTRKVKSIMACKRGHESEVIDDLRLASYPESIHCSSHHGWVEVTSSSPVYDSAWALQVMPDCVNISGRSESKLADDASKIIISVLKPHLSAASRRESGATGGVRWTLHAIPATAERWQSKIKPLGDRIKDQLVSVYGKYHASVSKSQLLNEGDILVQCFLKDATTLSISVTEISKTQYFWNKPVPWHAGVMSVRDSSDYPAESFKKCKEIFRHMSIAEQNGLEGKRVVELGANPGGWTLVLLEAGARLTSVDWADLQDPRFKDHPRLNHICTDARIFNPIEAGIIAPRNSQSSQPSQSPQILQNDTTQQSHASQEPQLNSGKIQSPNLVANETSTSSELLQDGSRGEETSTAMRETANSTTQKADEELSSRHHVDYLFADLALPPEKSLIAFNQWLDNQWTQSFAWTFKFGFHPTTEKYAPMIDKIRKTLQAHGPELKFSIRHLSKHENEIVVLGGWKNKL